MLENLLSSKIIIGSIIACGLIIIGALIQTPQKRSDTPKTTSDTSKKIRHTENNIRSQRKSCITVPSAR